MTYISCHLLQYEIQQVTSAVVTSTNVPTEVSKEASKAANTVTPKIGRPIVPIIWCNSWVCMSRKNLRPYTYNGTCIYTGIIFKKMWNLEQCICLDFEFVKLKGCISKGIYTVACGKREYEEREHFLVFSFDWYQEYVAFLTCVRVKDSVKFHIEIACAKYHEYWNVNCWCFVRTCWILMSEYEHRLVVVISQSIAESWKERYCVHLQIVRHFIQSKKKRCLKVTCLIKNLLAGRMNGALQENQIYFRCKIAD